MNYKELKQEIIAIAEIAENVPEKFKDKCFEMLMEHLLNESRVEVDDDKKNGQKVTEEGKASNNGEDGTNQLNDKNNLNNIPISAQLRVFMRKTELSIEEIQKIVHYEDGTVFFIKEPKDKLVSKGQLKWSLLIGLKNGILSKDFTVDPEDLRSICQDKGYYDMKNFSKNLKTSSNLFKNPLVAQGEPQSLSDDGFGELAKLVKELIQQ